MPDDKEVNLLNIEKETPKQESDFEISKEDMAKLDALNENLHFSPDPTLLK